MLCAKAGGGVELLTLLVRGVSWCAVFRV